ncbi:MAG: 2Fe-2S iron-sulfur cluster binding domain-containing protein [Methylococcales bacterium]|nr:2Fe-2S iron-sulfur cluster binding domain-containing protein [Methylococcales bacterium]
MATHQVTIITQDEQTVEFECRSDEDIITAALRQSIYLMASCREGGCATCKGFCADGEYLLGKYSAQALPDEEEAAGEILLCACFPSTDMEIEVPYTYDRISFSPENLFFEAQITKLQQLSSNVIRIVLERIGEQKQVKFESGQFFDLEIPGTTTTRSYSPANIENKEGILEFFIRIVEDGKFSTYLKNEATIGQILRLKGASGIFGLKANGFTPRFFVAGGTGLAPVLSMVRHMQKWDEPQKCVIYFGVNTEEEVFLLDDLEKLASQMPTLELRACVWKYSDSWHGEKGSVVDILRRDLQLTGVNPDLYLCGPPGMVDATFAVCEDLGIPKKQIYLEKFLSNTV